MTMAILFVTVFVVEADTVPPGKVTEASGNVIVRLDALAGASMVNWPPPELICLMVIKCPYLKMATSTWVKSEESVVVVPAPSHDAISTLTEDVVLV